MTGRLHEQSRDPAIRTSNQAEKTKRERTPFKMREWKSAKPPKILDTR